MISNKKEMYALYNKHAFGNSVRVWHSDKDLLSSGYDGLLGIRTSSGSGGGPFVYGLSVPGAIAVAGELRRQGWACLYSEFTSTDHITIQGELADFPEGYAFWYSRVKKPMREALAENSCTVLGREAEYLVRSSVSESDWSDIVAVFDRWPGHVIEFTVFDHYVGETRGRTAVIWEVRAY